jgi:hypothetical protein
MNLSMRISAHHFWPLSSPYFTVLAVCSILSCIGKEANPVDTTGNDLRSNYLIEKGNTWTYRYVYHHRTSDNLNRSTRKGFQSVKIDSLNGSFMRTVQKDSGIFIQGGISYDSLDPYKNDTIATVIIDTIDYYLLGNGYSKATYETCTLYSLSEIVKLPSYGYNGTLVSGNDTLLTYEQTSPTGEKYIYIERYGLYSAVYNQPSTLTGFIDSDTLQLIAFNGEPVLSQEKTLINRQPGFTYTYEFKGKLYTLHPPLIKQYNHTITFTIDSINNNLLYTSLHDSGTNYFFKNVYADEDSTIKNADTGYSVNPVEILDSTEHINYREMIIYRSTDGYTTTGNTRFQYAGQLIGNDNITCNNILMINSRFFGAQINSDVHTKEYGLIFLRRYMPGINYWAYSDTLILRKFNGEYLDFTL